MTRFARGGTANKKKPHEGSTWDELSVEKLGKSQNQKPKKAGKLHHDTEQDKHQSNPPNEVRKESGRVKDKVTQKKKERQRERRRLKRQQEREIDKVCYNCRKPGHRVAECPVINTDREQGMGICFKCGSTEHSSGQCQSKTAPGEYPFAKCFICGEKGHISKQCPDNPRGLYPKGGCCKLCGSVEHFRKDCPELQKQQGIPDLTLSIITGPQSVDAQDDNTEAFIPVRKKKAKVVSFL